LIGTATVAALRVGALMLLPASVAVLGVSGRVFEAVNPVVLVKMIRRLGSSYLLIVAATAAPVTLAWLIVVHVFDWMALPLALVLALLMYACLAAFSVIGGVLYDRRTGLGLETWRSPERERARAKSEIDQQHERLIDELYGHWRGGARTEALQAAHQWLAAHAIRHST